MEEQNTTKEQMLSELGALGEYVTQSTTPNAVNKQAPEQVNFMDAALRSIRESVIAADTEYKVLFWNKASEQIYGIPESEAIGKKLTDVIEVIESSPGENRQRFRKIEKEGYHREDQLHRTKRRDVWVDLSVQTIEKDGKRYGWIALATDITKRKQAEEELLKSRQLLENITHGITDKVLLISTDFKVLWANKSASDRYGYRKEEPDGEYCYKVTQGRDSPCEPCPFHELMKTGKPVTITHKHFKADGNTTFSEAIAYPIKNEQGQVVQFIDVSRDITERKRMEEEIRQSEIKYRTLVQRLNEGVYQSDVEGKYITLNEAGARIFGFDSPEQVIGKYKTKDFYYEPSMWEKIFEDSRTSDTSIHEVKARKIDGTPIWILINNNVRLGEAGNVVGYEGVFTDITERKRLADELRALSDRLVNIQEEECRRISRGLHDNIGQILTGLKLSLEIASRLPDQNCGDVLRDAQNQVSELMTYVRQLSLDLWPATLDDLGLIATLSSYFERYTSQTNIRVTFEHSSYKRACATGAETTAYRIVQEALTNVARHAEVDEVIVRLWDELGRIWLLIEDHGMGFDYKAALKAGVSLGLASMRERAELLGGRLTVDSTPGKGTRLIASLPMKKR